MTHKDRPDKPGARPGDRPPTRRKIATRPGERREGGAPSRKKVSVRRKVVKRRSNSTEDASLSPRPPGGRGKGGAARPTTSRPPRKPPFRRPPDAPPIPDDTETAESLREASRETPCPICGGTHYNWGKVHDSPVFRFRSPDGSRWDRKTVYGGEYVKARVCMTCGNIQVFVKPKH
jgi:hypothetical protein